MENLELVEIVNRKMRTYADFKAALARKNRLHAGYTSVMVNNGVVELETKALNKIKSISVDKKTIVPDEMVTYTVTLDNSHPDAVLEDLSKVKFCFWLQKRNEKNVLKNISLEMIEGLPIAQTAKSSIKAVLIHSKGDKGSVGHIADFTLEDEATEYTRSMTSHGYFYADIRVDEEAKKTILIIKYPKWMDNYRIRVEAYLNDEILGNGADSTASRYVKAKPEIVDAYWKNAAGMEMKEAGYQQDLYLVLNTLGLKGETLDLRVYDEDMGQTDDRIEWKNNMVKITSRFIIKQFEVGDKKRYEDAQQDEEDEEQYAIMVNFGDNKKEYLELYIKIHNGEAKKVENLKEHYGKVKLTNIEKITRAFFAKDEKIQVQSDTKETKKNPIPIKNVAYHKMVNKGYIGQKVKLVAVCHNLEGKEVVFKIYEKKSLLAGSFEELPILYKGAEVTEVKTRVVNGFATVEIVLQRCKQKQDNNDWAKLLFHDSVTKKSEIKSSGLYISVRCDGEVLRHEKDFLKTSLFKLSTKTCGCERCVNYQDVWPNPEISDDNATVNSNRYLARGGNHKGVDIKTGANYKELHTLLCGEVVYTKSSLKTNKYIKGSLGNVITILSNDKEGNKIFIMYCHLDKVYVKKGDWVIHGENIGLSGSTGNASDSSMPNGKKGKGIKKEFWHVHIETATTYGYSATMKNQARKNPELFMKTKFDKDGSEIL